MKQGIHLIITIILFTLVVEARPSWCSNAHSQVEHRICDNSELSVLDDKITKLYRNVRKGVSGASKKRLVSAQRTWIKNRNSNCQHSDDSCIKEYYVSRIQALGEHFSTQSATVTGLDPNGDGFLSLRKKPHQREIGKLYNGDKLTILSKSGKYYKVKDVKSGMIGYAHSNWIRINQSSTSTSSSQKKGTVTGLDPNGDGFLAVRSEPKGRKLGELHNGDTVAILGQRGAWYKVRTSSGLVGWSHGDWIVYKNNKNKFSQKKENAIALVIEKWYELENLDESLKKDRDVVLAAVKQKGSALRYAGESLKKDKEVALASVKQDGNALEYVDDSLKKDREVVFTAVKEEGTALIYADDSLKKDKEVVLAAVKSNGKSLYYTGNLLKNDKDIVKKAIDSTYEALCYASDKLRSNREMVEYGMNKHYLAFSCIEDKFLSSEQKSPPESFKRCIGCHGAIGDKKALNKSRLIATMGKKNILKAINGYKDGSYGGELKSLMIGQVENLSNEDAQDIANYLDSWTKRSVEKQWLKVKPEFKESKSISTFKIDSSIVKIYHQLKENKINKFNEDLHIKIPNIISSNMFETSISYDKFNEEDELYIFIPEYRNPFVIKFSNINIQSISFKISHLCDSPSRIFAILKHSDGTFDFNEKTLNNAGMGENDKNIYCSEYYGKYIFDGSEIDFGNFVKNIVFTKNIKAKLSKSSDKLIIKMKPKLIKTDGYFSNFSIESNNKTILTVLMSENIKTLNRFRIKTNRKLNDTTIHFKYSDGGKVDVAVQ